MDKKIIILTSNLFVFLFLISCKNELNNKLNVKEKQFDTIYFEKTNSIDTILMPIKYIGKSIWINKILFKKSYNKKKIIIAYSLSDNNYIYIDNMNDRINKKILGTDIQLYKESFNDYELIKIENNSYKSGNLINSINVFYINNKLKVIKNKEFFLNSTNNGKSFDKSIFLVKNSDTVYYIIK
ncbi:MAG: hypothetical protein EAZ85_12285 [Bacteroidetes bacterium]|nr:MAG: hypothetical protein EAZ85_12285 [Bacteroidota bacterium]